MESDAALLPEDATYVSSVIQNQQNIKKIELDDLIDMEKDLSVGEKIGLIFLLYGSDKDLVSAGIQNILLIQRNPTNESTYIYEWAKMAPNWQESLIESLCILQSYHVTENLHLDMKRLEEVYMPYRCGVSLYINPLIKSLFLMSERLLMQDTEKLIRYMRDRGTAMAMQNSNNYLELHLLDWIRNGLIEVHTGTKIDLLMDFLKQFELDDALEALEAMKPRIKKEFKKESATKNDERENGCYKIRRESCGWVLIINQKVFIKPDPSKIPPNVEIEEHLSVRAGTDADCIALKQAFSARGYKIEQRNNLTHIQIQKALHDIVEASVVYDSLVVCILSHGNKGVVFGSDYIPVNINTIQEILSSERLLTKPKVLIIQACQGKKKNTTITSERRAFHLLETDDGSDQPVSAPKYADLLTAMSTIEGFVSIRDRELGTWYINEVCKSIDDRGDDEHILDLLTDVNNKVAQKRHKEEERELCMLPEFSVRLLKKMYLPKKVCEEEVERL